jgi:hypothetical protein
MATGVAGSSLADELNRLANGGTYPVTTAYESEQGAANAWAGTNGLGLIAALNYKASSTRQPTNYKDFNAICNELAGTTGLSGVVALRSINL